VAHDHPALRLVGQELGVKVTIAGPNMVDIPGLVAAIEQTTARRPAGMMVVGWDPSALVPPINQAMDAGIPWSASMRTCRPASASHLLAPTGSTSACGKPKQC